MSSTSSSTLTGKMVSCEKYTSATTKFSPFIHRITVHYSLHKESHSKISKVDKKIHVIGNNNKHKNFNDDLIMDNELQDLVENFRTGRRKVIEAIRDIADKVDEHSKK